MCTDASNEAAYLYDTSSWGYQLDGAGRPQRAKSLDDQRYTFARLRSFFSRDTRELTS